MEIDLDAYLPRDAFVRKLDKAINYDRLFEQLSPYFSDARGVTSAPVRAVLLILLEHLQPYAIHNTDKPFLASIHYNWQIDLSYMWLLHAAPQEIPAFEDVFYPVYDALPPDVLSAALYEILQSCFAQRVAAECRDDPLYSVLEMKKPEQDAELRRLAHEYADSFYQEVKAYKEWKDGGAESGPIIVPVKERG
ncbi:MAG: hypothetical protein IJQ98_06370 [Oscillospiraceae bacterium]|nr:hypothetical protein [Clostridia bacterium]MBR0311999.1 hypothetical protein [Oscillospiraceae bacterium]